MKTVLTILFAIVAWAAIMQATLVHVSDAKSGQDKLAEALGRLESWRAEKAEEKRQLYPDNANINSASMNGIGINNTNSANITNSNKVLYANSTPLEEANASSLAGQQNIGSGSKGRFSGYYGIDATRHEIGKSGINSHMSLSGNFEMDKTVKFQDQGID